MDTVGMRKNSLCVSCVAKSQIEKMPADASEEQKLLYLKDLFSILYHWSGEQGAPEIAAAAYHLREKLFTSSDDYTELKAYFNQLLMNEAGWIQEEIRQSKEPLKTAMQYSMAGNFIDFSMPHAVKEETLRELLHKAREKKISEKTYRQLREDLKEAKEAVILLDNCGEIVLDQLLIREVKNAYPQLHFTAVVRGEMVVNDVTMEDAEQVGLTADADVITSGSGVGGTCMHLISEEARELLEHADIILSKGQGNFETMNGCGLNVYYLFLSKCNLIIERFGGQLFDLMLINEHCPQIEMMMKNK